MIGTCSKRVQDAYLHDRLPLHHAGGIALLSSSGSCTPLAPASFLPATMFSSTRRVLSRCRAQPSRRRLATSAPQHPSGRHGLLPGSTQSAITTKLHFFNSVMGDDKQIPTYRVLDKDGKPVDGVDLPDMDEDFCRKL